MKNDEPKNPEYEKIGDKIKKARDEAGLSQLQLAQKIGKESSTYVALIESGDRKVSIVDLIKIAELLGKSIEYFVEGSDSLDEQSQKIDYALRTAKKLNEVKQKQIVDFIDFIKRRNDK